MTEPVEAIVCSNCGAMLRPGMLRCRECGTPVSGSLRGLPTDPDTRPQESASAKGTAPLDSVSHETTTASGARRSWRLTVSTKPFRVGSVIVVALLLIAAAGWLLSKRQSLPREVSRVMAAPGERLTCVVISRDGHSVFAGSASGNVMVWELPSGAMRTLPKQSDQPILSLAISSDGFLVAGGVDPKLLGWENATDASKTKVRSQDGFPSSIVCIGLRPNASEMVVGLADGSLMFFGSREPLRIPSAHPNGVRVLAYSPDGRTLVTGGVEGMLVWRNADSGESLGPPVPFSADLGGVSVSPDGALTVAGDWNGQLRWFETATRKATRDVELPDAVSAVGVTDNLVIATGWDGRLRAWTRAGGSEVLNSGIAKTLTGLAIAPTGGWAATVANDERLLIWDLPR